LRILAFGLGREREISMVYLFCSREIEGQVLKSESSHFEVQSVYIHCPFSHVSVADAV
jgi:hypothetical protein